MLGLAFEGCAFKAAFHAGVAAALAEHRVVTPLVAGASSGALIAVGIAAGRALDLPDVFRRFADRSLWSIRRALWNRSVCDMSHLLSTSLTQLLGATDLREVPVEALISATRLPSLECRVFSTRDEPELIRPLLGSCFIPGIYGRPVALRGELLLDGGVTDNLPLEALVRHGATEVIAVVTQPDGLALKRLGAPRWRPEVRGVKVHILKPTRALGLRSWDTQADRLAAAIDDGYQCGRAFAG
jgi:NTE family protein